MSTTQSTIPHNPIPSPTPNTIILTDTLTGPMLAIYAPSGSGSVSATCLLLVRGGSAGIVHREENKSLLLPIQGVTVAIATIPGTRDAVREVVGLVEEAVRLRRGFWYERFLLEMMERGPRRGYVVVEGVRRRLEIVLRGAEIE